MALLSLIGRLGLDTSGFEGGLKKAESAASSFASSMTAKVGGALAGAFSIAYVEQMIEKINESAVNVANLGKQYELTTEEVQRLQKATGKLGLDFDAVAGAIGRVQKARAMAFAGGEQGDKAIAMFKQLGISKQDATNPLKSFVDLMEVYSETSSRGKVSREAEFELFGKNAVQIKSIMKELHALGPIKLIDTENIAEALEDLKQEKKEASERKENLLPVASGFTRFKTGFKKTLNEEMAQGFGGGPIGLISGLLESVQSGIVNAFAGKISTSEPDQARVSRVAEKEARGVDSVIRNAQLTLLRASNPQAGGMGNIASIGSGNLANVGGYFFGGNVNNAIANNTLKAAGLLTDIKKDTAAFRGLLGNEGSAQ
jgi:hypothetical protein